LSYTQRLTYEDNNKTLAGCLQPIRMTTIIWKLLKMSKYPYDNDNLYQLTDKSETPLISSYLLLSPLIAEFRLRLSHGKGFLKILRQLTQIQNDRTLANT